MKRENRMFKSLRKILIFLTLSVLMLIGWQGVGFADVVGYNGIYTPPVNQFPSWWPWTTNAGEWFSASNGSTGDMYLGGGMYYDSSGTQIWTNKFIKYNTRTRVWSQLANLPVTGPFYMYGANSMAVGFNGESVYLWVTPSGQTTSQLWKYNVSTNVWSDITSVLPSTLKNRIVENNAVLAVFGSTDSNGNPQTFLLLAGGASTSGSDYTDTYIYDTVKGTWWNNGSSVATIPFDRSYVEYSQSIGWGSVYAFGGEDATNPSNLHNDLYNFNTNISKWIQVMPDSDNNGVPKSTTGSLVGTDGWMSVVGGVTNSAALSSIYEYSPSQNRFIQDAITNSPEVSTVWTGFAMRDGGSGNIYIMEPRTSGIGPYVIYSANQQPMISSATASGVTSGVTSSTSTTVDINANDVAGIKSILLSNDGFQTVTTITPAVWQPGTSANSSMPSYVQSLNNYQVPYTIPFGTGSKQIDVKVVNEVGIESSGYQIPIYLNYNTTPPASTLSLNNGATQTTTASINVSVSGVDKQTPTNQLSMVVSMDGINFYTVSGSTFTPVSSPSAYYPNTFNGSFTIPLDGTLQGGSSSAGNKYVYVIVTDQNQNNTILNESINYNPPGNTVQPTTTQTALTDTTSSSGPYSNGTVTTINGTPTLISTSNAIQLSVSNVQNATQYRISTNGGITASGWQPITASSIQTGVTFPSEGIQNLYVQLSNGTTQSQWYNYQVLVDYTAPQVTVETLSGATATSAGSQMNLSVQATDNIGGLPLYYSVNGSSFAQLPSDGTVPVTVTSGRNTFTVVVSDIAGNKTTKTVRVDGL